MTEAMADSTRPGAAGPAGRRTLYLVRRRPSGDSREEFLDGQVEQAFADRAEAERFRVECELKAQLSCNDPGFWYRDNYLAGRESVSSPLQLTSFDPPVFFDWLQDADIPLPRSTDDPHDWMDWVQECLDLPEHQRRKLFEALDRFRFYEVFEVEWAEDGDRAGLPDYGAYPKWSPDDPDYQPSGDPPLGDPPFGAPPSGGAPAASGGQQPGPAPPPPDWFDDIPF